jgi:hypothetical protein
MATKYHAVLVRFMTFTNGETYGDDHQFVQDELAPLTPDDVTRWLCEQAYGTTEPAPDANPTNARSASLMFWKKAISFFMPNKLMPWDAITGHGNPTRSIEVNEFIKKVKTKEVRKQGADSRARRAITHEIGDGNDGNNPNGRQNKRDLMLVIQSQMSALQRSMEDLKTKMEQYQVEERRGFETIQANVRRIAIQHRRANGPNGGAVAVVIAAQISTLSANPRTLYSLWAEYKNGIGGRKAARLFSRAERGKVKYKYSRRKVVWDCISTLVGAGLTSQVAIDRIYQVYGENTAMTKIINMMKHDRQAGVMHPLLQV